MKTSASDFLGGLVRERWHARVRLAVCLAVCVGLSALACLPGISGWWVAFLVVEAVIAGRGVWLEVWNVAELTVAIEREARVAERVSCWRAVRETMECMEEMEEGGEW